MGLLKKVFDRVGEIIDDSKWNGVEEFNCKMRYWVEKFAENSSRYHYFYGDPEYYWDGAIAYATIKILGDIKEPDYSDTDWDYPPDREDFPELKFEPCNSQLKIDKEDERIIQLAFENSFGQNNTSYFKTWFRDKEKFLGLK